MPESMHLLEMLERRGYRPQDDARPGEGWFDQAYRGTTVRVVLCLAGNEAMIVLFDEHMTAEWRARFDDGTPSAVILGALRAAELEAGDERYCTACRVPDHDQCGGNAGCRCCADARRQA